MINRITGIQFGGAVRLAAFVLCGAFVLGEVRSAGAVGGIALTQEVSLHENTTPVGTSYDDANILFGKDGVCLAIWSSNTVPGGDGSQDREIYFTRSTDGGLTWSEGSRLNSDGDSEGGTDSHATLATDDAGTWIAVWTSDANLNGSGSDFDLRFSKSVDNGISWSAPAILNTNAASDSGYDLYPAIATDTHGRWIVTWRSNENLGGLTDGDDDIFYAVSDNAGDAWTAPKALNTNANGDAGADLDPRIATDRNGNWIAVWHSDRTPGSAGNDSDILSARSTNNGQSWSFPAAVNPGALNDSLADIQPDIFTVDGTWVCAWSHDEVLEISRSTDVGQNWGAPTIVDSTVPAKEYTPRLAGISGGRWVVAWNGSFLSRSVAISLNDGVDWSANLMDGTELTQDVAVALNPADGRLALQACRSTFATNLIYGSATLFSAPDNSERMRPTEESTTITQCLRTSGDRIEVEFRNIGTTTWTPADYGFQVSGSTCSFAPASVAPVQRNILPRDSDLAYLDLHLSGQPEICSFNVQMSHNGVGFGPISHFEYRYLDDENAVVDQVEVPALTSGQQGILSVKLTNIGCGVWFGSTAPQGYSHALQVIEDAGGLTNNVRWIPRDVAQLQQGTFTTNLKAPPAEGDYTIKLQMTARLLGEEQRRFGPIIEAVVHVENTVPDPLDFATDTFNWFGGTAGGTGEISIDDRGICMTAPELGDNVVGWVSPQAYCPLRDTTVYRMRIETTTNQVAENAIPYLDFIYDNFPANTYGGELMILDNTGGANGIGRPQGRTSFEMWAAPNAIETLQWRGLLNNGVAGENDNSAFTTASDAGNDMRLIIRLNDIGSAGINANSDSGTVCVRRLEITAFGLGELSVDPTPLYAPPINSNTHGAERFDQMGAGSAEINDDAAEARFSLLPSGLGGRKTLFPWDRTDGAPSLFYPVSWTSNQLIKGTLGVRSRVSGAEGSDPVDDIGILFDVPTVEVQSVHMSNRGNPGNMNLAASPRRVQSTGGAPQPYTAYYFTHNRTAIDTTANPGADRLRVQGDFFNLAEIAPQGQGADPVAATSLKLESVTLP